MLRRVALVRTDVSELCIASIIRVNRIGELGTTLAVVPSLQRAYVASYRYFILNGVVVQIFAHSDAKTEDISSKTYQMENVISLFN
jgi:hypothetical protein